MEGAPILDESKEDIAYPAIASEIIQMAEVDQAMRKRAMKEEDYWDSEVDLRNTARMKEIVDKIGWPTISKVGKQASRKAWLIIQHANSDKPFMQDCLELMQVEPPTEVDPKDMAYLDDRLRVFSNRPQVYGTQIKEEVDGVPIPFEIEDAENVDKRRFEIGMETLQDYLNAKDDDYEEE